ncbi:phosphatidyl synthase [Aspergillus vadensis CBS 113365]|uniref:Uncharacterized protein n=1 Tax=Aspergillus vadensis (strain CBS 113365 / IMI 142717 / IBT 24658) TaxID=1448311 RepID=A0A319BQV4_ASPVC|nr:hypothetical protein BO88DRAFT_448642 [Aspergillus vadensis CBS 113365]PYH74847.1 hypothetical protein BO88DRAFT_448642 [Aspergillus vadensis CBS 113365]
MPKGTPQASHEAMQKKATGKDLNTIHDQKTQLGTYQAATPLVRQRRKNTQHNNKPTNTADMVAHTHQADTRRTKNCNDTRDDERPPNSVKKETNQKSTTPPNPPKKTCKHRRDAVKFAKNRQKAKNKKHASAAVNHSDSEWEPETPHRPN